MIKIRIICKETLLLAVFTVGSIGQYVLNPPSYLMDEFISVQGGEVHVAGKRANTLYYVNSYSEEGTNRTESNLGTVAIMAITQADIYGGASGH